MKKYFSLISILIVTLFFVNSNVQAEQYSDYATEYYDLDIDEFNIHCDIDPSYGCTKDIVVTTCPQGLSPDPETGLCPTDLCALFPTSECLKRTVGIVCPQGLNPDPETGLCPTDLCALFPTDQCLNKTGSGGNGISEPMGILAGLTALTMFMVARRRK